MKELNSKKIDQAARRLVRASVLSEREATDAVSSPYVFSRLRARINADSEGPDQSSLWAGLALSARTAIPGMALVAAVSFGLLLYVNGNKPQAPAFSVDAYVDSGNSGFDNMLSAERRPVTSEEVLKSIVNKDEREVSK
jgi:hypothetical protein